MLKKIFLLILSAIIALPLGLVPFVGASDENAVFVAPDGDDNASGSIFSPLATLSAAKEKAKEADGNVNVYFREGSYTFSDTVCFTQADKSNVTYKAYNGEKVIFTSGKPCTGFEECTVNGVKALKKNVGKGADFNVLFNEETTLSRTRYPESGYLYVENVLDSDIINPEHPDLCHRGCSAMVANKNDLADFKNSEDVLIRILHYWKDEMLTVKSYDSSTGYLTFSRPTSMNVAKGDRYFLQNVFEALNEPGEWYLDKSEGILYYIPQQGENAESLTLWGSEVETMISVDGVDGITFENIIFRGNGFNIPMNNTGRDQSTQAAYDATPCVSYVNATDFGIKNCEFRDIAACAVYMGEGVQNAEVDSSYFENLGAQAVFIKGENVPINDPIITKNINITNNCISTYGRVFFNAVGILVIHANTVNIYDNEIHDGYYTAISVGWVWGYSYSVTYNNKICNNLIYNIGQGWLSDMGGIYTLGNQPGTVISGNVIHNVAADPGQSGYGGWGIYLDEGSAYIHVEKNLVYACGNDSYHLHYGSYNTVTNNIFALSGESQVRVCSNPSRVTPSDGGKISAAFTNNIILTDNKVRAFSYLQNKEAYEERGNIFWDLTYRDKIFVSIDNNAKKSMSIETAERKGYITNPLVADPMFKDAANFDFELSGNSPVFEAGFEAWDYSQAGTNPGTAVGLSMEGGSTPYNAEAVAQKPTPSREPWHFFICIFNKIAALFNKIFK